MSSSLKVWVKVLVAGLKNKDAAEAVFKIVKGGNEAALKADGAIAKIQAFVDYIQENAADLSTNLQTLVTAIATACGSADSATAINDIVAGIAEVLADKDSTEEDA